MPDGFFAIVDPDQIAVAIGDANVRSSDVANVEMSDGPSMTSGPSVAAVSTLSFPSELPSGHRVDIGKLARCAR